MVDLSLKNMLSIKVILAGFKMVSGFKMNFFKSSLIGINMDLVFLSSTINSLHCEIDYLLFKYLGFSVEDNPQI